MNHKVLLQWITYNLTSDFKAEVGSLVFVSSGKNSTATFQQIVIQVVWKKTRLRLLSLVLH